MPISLTKWFSWKKPHPDNSPRLVDIPNLAKTLDSIDELLHDQPDQADVLALIQAATSGTITKPQIQALIKVGDDAVVSKIMGDLTPAELDTIFELAAAFKAHADSSESSIAAINTALSNRARLDATNTFLEKVIFKKVAQVLGTLDVRGDLYLENHAIITSDSDGVDSDRTGENIDHIWHDDTRNAWNFVSDGPYKSQGNATLNAGRVRLENLAKNSNANHNMISITVDGGEGTISENRTYEGIRVEQRSAVPKGAANVDKKRVYKRGISSYTYNRDGGYCRETVGFYASVRQYEDADTGLLLGAYLYTSTSPESTGEVDTLAGSYNRVVLAGGHTKNARGLWAEVNPDDARVTVDNVKGVFTHMNYDAGIITEDPVALYQAYDGSWSGRKRIGIQQKNVQENQLTGKTLVDGHEVAHQGNIKAIAAAAGVGAKIYNGSSVYNLNYGVGETVLVKTGSNEVKKNQSSTIYAPLFDDEFIISSSSDSARLTGTWRCRGPITISQKGNDRFALYVRIA